MFYSNIYIILIRLTQGTFTQSAHPCCLNVYLQLQIIAALLKLTVVLNISCTHSAAELLNFSI